MPKTSLWKYQDKWPHKKSDWITSVFVEIDSKPILSCRKILSSIVQGKKMCYLIKGRIKVNSTKSKPWRIKLKTSKILFDTFCVLLISHNLNIVQHRKRKSKLRKDLLGLDRKQTCKYLTMYKLIKSAWINSSNWTKLAAILSKENILRQIWNSNNTKVS